jgi:hypothetical protein
MHNRSDIWGQYQPIHLTAIVFFEILPGIDRNWFRNKHFSDWTELNWIRVNWMNLSIPGIFKTSISNMFLHWHWLKDGVVLHITTAIEWLHYFAFLIRYLSNDSTSKSLKWWMAWDDPLCIGSHFAVEFTVKAKYFSTE